jgi:hypothetical protein
MSAAALMSSRQPKKFGYWMTRAAVWAVTALPTASRSVEPSPRGVDLRRSPCPSQYVSTTWRYSGLTPFESTVALRSVTA